MSSDFKLALRGDLQATINSRKRAYLSGLSEGTKQSRTLMKNEMRQDVQRAGLSRRVATTIRDSQFPQAGLSYSPSALIYSKIPHILSTLADGPTIRPSKAEGLTIPIPGGPAERLRVRRGENIIDVFETRFGEGSLFPIRRRDGTTILAARMRATSAGRFTKLRARKATKTQGARTLLSGLVTVPVFTLSRQAKHKRRLNLRKIMEKNRRRHPDRLAFFVVQGLERSNRETGINF